MRTLTLKIDLDKLEAARAHPDARTTFNTPEILASIGARLADRGRKNPDGSATSDLSFFGIPVGTASLEETPNQEGSHASDEHP